MFTIQSDFNNQYGMNLKGFTLLIADINYSSTNQIFKTFVDGVYQETLSSYKNITYRVLSYPNEELALLNQSGQPVIVGNLTEFYSINEPDIPDDVLVEDYCKAHFLGLIDHVTVIDGAVPFSVTRRQAKQQLALMGLLEQVPLVIDAVEDPMQRNMIKIFWEDSTAFERYNPHLVMLAGALGMSETDLDNAFISAKKL